MAKVKHPLFSLDARRKLGDEIVYGHRKKANIVETRPIPTDARSVGQLSWRHMFQKVVALWHALSAVEKEAWESLGRKRHMTGYAWFVSQALRPNPGIYLPLQGGTMTGEILMGTNSIKGLPLPTGSGHATRKSYVDGRVTADILTHKGDGSAHHGRYTDGEAVDAMGAKGDANPLHHDKAAEWGAAEHTAIGDAGPHHARYTDGEAVNAMGAKGDANPLHHDKAAEWGAAEHTAIGDAGPHHARYADVEAVTAAKTVKLDDFATPDDNADLNASTTRHGLLKKLSNVATQFLNGQGNFAVPAVAALASGTYTGNGADNRAIAHGLGETPRMVLICQQGKSDHGIVTGERCVNPYRDAAEVVTDWDATNFYVSETNVLLNAGAKNYNFIAFGS